MAITVINGGGDSTKVPITRTINSKKLSNNIILSASDVGALPDSTSIPSKTSDLTNDSNYVTDASYVHTDNNYTTTDKAKLDGIADSATANTVVTYSGTIDTTSWMEMGYREGSKSVLLYYYIDISISGILATDTPIVDLVTTLPRGYETNLEVYKEEQECWGKIFKAECSDGKITFYAPEIPTRALNFIVKVVR